MAVVVRRQLGGDRANPVAADRLVGNRLVRDGYTFSIVGELLGVAPYQGGGHVQ